MGCGCGKRFTKASKNAPTPPAILEEIARRMSNKSKTEANSDPSEETAGTTE